jgi:hypothetical protein
MTAVCGVPVAPVNDESRGADGRRAVELAPWWRHYVFALVTERGPP